MNKNRMPVVFVGHGSPMNAIEDNHWSRGFARLADEFIKPNAILAISAHWYLEGTFVTGNTSPGTIHDFAGFPNDLYKIEYPAPGSMEIADKVVETLELNRSNITLDWGLDHGTWSVLRWMYPDADIPVIQLSIDYRLEEKEHLSIAQALQDLRNKGVLILGSGNIVHNLRDAFSQKNAGTEIIPDWAKRFDEAVVKSVESYQVKELLNLSKSEDGQLSHPTPDHWLPLIYVYGAAEEGESVRFPIAGFDWGSLSRRTVIFG
ncbi:MAG: 4,5-DOPA dioxygenase extradiol [Pseudohongiellaceae bacterium]